MPLLLPAGTVPLAKALKAGTIPKQLWLRGIDCIDLFPSTIGSLTCLNLPPMSTLLSKTGHSEQTVNELEGRREQTKKADNMHLQSLTNFGYFDINSKHL